MDEAVDIEFSTLNLQYLLQARELARVQPTVAASILGLPQELVTLFAGLNADQLAGIAKVKTPLLVARGDPWWWSRLLTALRDSRVDEIEAVLEHAQLALVR